MHDLRKQVLLESGKTLSRKARSKQTTPSSSRANSAAPSQRGSRVPSANVSDDEGDFSDGTQWSSNSIDEMIAPDVAEEDEAPEAWIADLSDRIDEICNRKRSSVQGREDCLTIFITRLTRHYAQAEIAGKVEELVPALLKSVRAGQSERETVLALKALALVVITDPSETIYDTIAGPIKTCITDGQHALAKIAAVHSLSVATFYGGAATEETEQVMDFFLDIASSDGAVVEEADNAKLVTAALQEWGFLATQLEDMEDATEAAMDTFVDQLDSSAVHVQVAAGENIALLYEKSYTEAESDDDEPEADPETETAETPHGNGHTPRMIKRYTVSRHPYALTQTLAALATASSKRLAKTDRKHLHQSFADILHTVEHPTRGPRYSTARDEDGREYGSRLTVTLAPGGAAGAAAKMKVDRWWKLHRLQGLKRGLGGGFLVHCEGNEVVRESLVGEF
ncbi:hypothetical protein LTR36_010461 [Oleoguttula mirabilis]|uniref:Interferon-related developmental regulator N-terminal domain-containing protein n=1 Tax=Oleoguttula mirabilis TaxID=1507867 RepID=A0AAV9J4N1_9PEZI|nr:hypothetical protein LTR36_010461 [Oleoguttula mirabilis]